MKKLFCIGLVLFIFLNAVSFVFAVQNTDGFSLSADVVRTPLKNRIKMQGFSLEEGVNGNTNMPAGVGASATQPSFFSGVYDGTHIWLCASSSDKLVSVSAADGSMRGYELSDGVNGNTNMGNAATKTGRFAGGVLIGEEIWFVPYSIDRLVKANITTGTMTGYSMVDGVNGNSNLGTLGTGNTKFGGGIYDGTNIWMVPAAASKVVKVDPVTGTMTGYDLTEGANGNTNMPTGNNFFNGGIFDGTYVWMIPFNSSKVVRLDPASGTMRGYDMTEGVNGNTNMGNLGNTPLLATYKFYGAAFDGTYIWMIPGNGNRVVRLDPVTGSMRGYEMADGVNGNTNMGNVATASYRFALGLYDGKHIWMIPSYVDRLVKLDPSTGSMTGYELDEGSHAATENTNMGDVATTSSARFFGGVFDGKNIWLAPWRSNRLIKVASAEYTYKVEYYLDDTSGVPIATANGTTAFLPGYQLTQADIDMDLGTNWMNAHRPAGYGAGTIPEGYPEISPDTENVVKVVYAANAEYSYKIEYYKDDTSEVPIASVNGRMTFLPDYQLTQADIDMDLGTNWMNAHRPAGYDAGTIPEGYPEISPDTENVVKVIYASAADDIPQTGRNISLPSLTMLLSIGLFVLTCCIKEKNRCHRSS